MNNSSTKMTSCVETLRYHNLSQNYHDRNLDPDEIDIVDLSEVANKPTYVILTLHRLILAENLKFFISLIILAKYS